MFSKIFIDRPILATVIAIVITVAGAIAMMKLATARYPDMAPPQVKVTATFPGANAETVEKTVAVPIEQEVNGAKKMLYMNATCANDGTYTLTVSFEIGSDNDLNAVEVQNRVSIATAKLPKEVQPQVERGRLAQEIGQRVAMALRHAPRRPVQTHRRDL